MLWLDFGKEKPVNPHLDHYGEEAFFRGPDTSDKPKDHFKYLKSYKSNDLWGAGITILFLCCGAYYGDFEFGYHIGKDRCFQVLKSRSVSNIDAYKLIPKIYLEVIDKCLSGVSNIKDILLDLSGLLSFTKALKKVDDRYLRSALKVLGKGSQATVYKGWGGQNPFKRVAIKCYIMEYMKHKSLSYFMDKKPCYFQTEIHLRQAIIQILKGVQCIHNNNIIHRDIKPGNILVSSDYTLKIADFGMSKHDEGERTISTQVGSPLFLAPISDRNNGTTVQTDLWSVGITILCMCLNASYN
ncbi:hypothetical protein DFA_11438 [Cavenderia fasciculata]|uniref:Protein kinase domain-containing protein n=1 Tax=Cavenderia fasciculata TaxID=261658 RepID=F4QCZ6_CACFS|nr:uncharacterized protein DFA_11438 [Cavenderia fasciculata]EGG13677.1 hypothetical protein DFA_11438 [Cavenderia fasciculata]|eukprot:XP_004350381.1 hypothetical protein DFA_11438 [Cavenderia fasciculata]